MKPFTLLPMLLLLMTNYSCMDSNVVPKEEFTLAEFQAVIPEFNSGLTHSMRYLTDQLGGKKVLDRKELNYRMKDYSRELISSNPFFNSVNNVMEPLFLNEFNISGRVHSESGLTSIQEQQISNIQAFMESSEDVDEFEDMVMSYLANIEGMQLTESERIFTFTIGIIAVEAAKFWEVNGDEIVEISGQGRINGWSWGSFAGAVLGGATTGALAGAAVGGTASLGTLAVPSAVAGGVAGGLLGGIGYAVNEVIKGIE